MKRLFAALVTAALAAASYVGGTAYIEANRPHIVGTNPGGVILEFITDYDELRRSGRLVIIDGLCVSACTLVVGLIPHERICVTPFARLAFHSAWVNTMAGPRFSREGTRLIWQLYPERIREILRERGWDGGEHPSLIYIESEDLQKLFRVC